MDDRENIVATVMGDFLPSFSFDQTSSVLLVEDYTDILTTLFDEQKVPHTTWNRRYVESLSTQPAAWPERQGYSHVLIRLPKSHDAFDFILHAVTSVSMKGAEIVVYGMNDEGIKSARKKLLAFFENCDIVGFKKGCRVLKSIDEKDTATKKSLGDFRKTTEISYSGKMYTINSYPGMFNDGALDDGTKLLLDAVLPILEGKKYVLDFACGTGIIAKVVKEFFPEIDINLLDNDIISLTAAKENLETIKDPDSLILGDSLQQCSKKKYDLIISNPPMHNEKDEHVTVIDQLITDTPRYLNNGGQLIIVTQSRLAPTLAKQFKEVFSTHSILAQNTKYKIWCGEK